MSWISITDKQTITFNNLIDGVNSGALVAKTTIPSSEECITKSQANDYITLDVNYPSYANKASNQLIVKGDLVTYSGRIYSTIDADIYYDNTTDYNWTLYSDNGGLTWSSLNNVFKSISRNSTGQYVLGATYGSVYVSSNYGSSFTEVPLSAPGVFVGSVVSTAVSSNGQYMFIITYPGNVDDPSIFRSIDYGVTWSLAFEYVFTENPGGFSNYLERPYPRIAVSGNGQYVTAVVNRSNGSFDWGSRILRSTNYGASFSVSGDYNLKHWTDVAINSTGQYQLFSRMSSFGTGNIKGQGAINWSNNYGAGTAQKIYEEDMRALHCAMSISGQYMLVSFINNTDSVNKFYYSTNYGVSWSSFNTNPVPPYSGGMPGGVFISPSGDYALITYVNRPEITYTTNFQNWSTVPISTSYNFAAMHKSK